MVFFFHRSISYNNAFDQHTKFYDHESQSYSSLLVGFLLVGPVATAKSLFLEELNRIPGSSYHLGSTATKAGLTQFLLNFRPRILLLDELEKMSREDFAALLSLMESGKVVETKFGRRSEEHMRVWVFAACNALKGIPPENLSRFPFRFHLREYTPEEYAQVAVRVLTEREGLDQGLAEYIAGRLSPATRDVRKAVGLGRVCSTREEVDQRIETLRKYKGI
jgi:Holliday junction DNA helicase RuvB